MYEILINALVFCIILLIIALIVAVIQSILILRETRKMTKEVSDKVLAVSSLLDVASIFFQGITGLKKRSGEANNLSAAISGIKKGLQVFLSKKEEKE